MAESGSQAPPPMTCAARVSRSAHELRNQVATLHAAATLIDDAEVAESVRAAVSVLRVSLERSIVAARIDLGERPEEVAPRVDELLDWAARRARREGGRASWVLSDPMAGASRHVPGPGAWLERLLTDVLLEAGDVEHVVVTIEAGEAGTTPVVLRVAIAPDDASLAELDAIARACGGTCLRADRELRIVLPGD